MIFVTVGGQLPFDRLVHAVDTWAGTREHVDVFAQIGDSKTPPRVIPWQRFLTATDFQQRAREADVLIGHAGMGTIFTAAELGKPLVVMPRRQHLGEHRNDHQWSTLQRVCKQPGITAAANADELLDALSRLEALPAMTYSRSREHARLVDFLRDFLDSPR